MKFFSIYTPANPTAAPKPEHMAQMGKLMAEGQQGGWLLDTGGLMPLNKGGAKVKRTDGKISVIDGPYAEAKEVVAGYVMIKAKNFADAAEIAKGCPALDLPGRSVEVRQIKPLPM